MAVPSFFDFEQGLQVSHELKLQIVNVGVFCILFSSLVPFQFSIYCVHLPLKANFKPVLFNLILLNCVCFYASL